MTYNRRRFIQHSLAMSAYAGLASYGLLNAQEATATWPTQYFAKGDLATTLRLLFGDAPIIVTEAISLKLPRIAENGAVVPITVTSSLPKVTDIAILVAKNPTPLSALFKLSPDLEPMVSARLKMAETCEVIAIVTSEGQLFQTAQEVKVTIGGCGG